MSDRCQGMEIATPTRLFACRAGLACIAIFLAVHTAPARAAAAQFTDVTAAAGVAVSHQTLAFYDHADYTGGGTVGDFNNDGWQDLFVLSGGLGLQRDYLFINDGDGTFTERAEAWGLDAVHYGKGAAVGDFNNDGFLDLFVTSAGSYARLGPGHHRLYRNNGDETFTNIAPQAGVAFSTKSQQGEDGFGATFGDYDLDGDLDLFVAGFGANNSGNRLFRNNGDETFTDVTDSIGLFSGTPISLKSFAPRFVDMDGDRYPELLLASDFGTSRYFRNNGNGTFTDTTATSGTGLDENGMGQAVGDFDGDGLPDWYVTSIYYPPNTWTGNKLYTNQGNHVYLETSVAAGVDDGGYGWAALAVDFNHDTRLDIAETNGANGGFGGEFDNEQSYLWIQNAGGSFDEQALIAGLVHTARGRGMSNFDYDNDGDQDVVIFGYNEPIQLFRNDVSGTDANWIRVFLEPGGATGVAPGGTGSKVTVTISGQSQSRWLTSGDNFLSHSELSAHFGLGTATSVDVLRVDWSDGSVTVLNAVTANRTITLEAGAREQSCTDGADNDGDNLFDCDDTDCCGLPGCQNGEGVCCNTALDCADALYCNGAEQCIDDTCVAGPDPCPGQACKESGSVCVACNVDADCDDGLFCNGVETCSANTCAPAADPCAPQLCDEEANACVECLTDLDCADDGSFCNGSEVCVFGQCDSSMDACPGLLCDEGGDTCIGTTGLQPRMGMPVQGLTASQLERFEDGRQAFQSTFVEASGLGPVYNAASCASCHAEPLGGTGAATVTHFGMNAGGGAVSQLPGGPILQSLATAPACAEMLPAQADVTTARLGSAAMFGLGLIETIPDEWIYGTVLSPPAGVSGRAQVIPILDEPGEMAVGRFGWKSPSAKVLSTTAGEARDQIGLTNRYLSADSPPNGDAGLLALCDTVADPEDGPNAQGFDFIDRVSDFVRYLAPPPQTPRNGMSGVTLFNQVKCGDCHRPFHITRGDPRYETAFYAKIITPYTDFLLHDMGAAGDPMPAGEALPGEVRTTPLWGLTARTTLWHDGRISGGTFESRVLAAIAEHDSPGSEAQASAQAFQALTAAERDSVVDFLASLGRAEFDHDGDNDVDADDFVTFTSCFTGPGTFYTPDDPCSISDIDADGDVDLDDRQMFDIAADGPAGRVPDGDQVVGDPLRLSKLAGSQVQLDWGASCSPGDRDYAVYEGTLGDFTSHVPLACTTGGQTSHPVLPGPGHRYYLVVATTEFREGSYGNGVAGAERASSASACLLQAMAACP